MRNVQQGGRRVAILGGAVATVILSLYATDGRAGVVHDYTFTVDASDAVGGVNATLVNGASVSGGELQLPGGGSGTANTSPNATLPAAAVAGLTAAFSLESYYTRASTSTNNYSTLFAFSDNTANNYVAATPGRGGGQDVMSVAYKQTGVNAGAEILLVGPVTTPSSTHYLATTFDGAGTLRLYSDGVAVAQSTLAAGFNLSTKGTRAGIGGNAPFGDQGMYGSQSEFRISNNAVTALDVATNYLRGPNNAAVVTNTSNASGEYGSSFDSGAPASNQIVSIAGGNSVTLSSGSGAAGIVRIGSGSTLNVANALAVGSIVDLADTATLNLNSGGTLSLRGLTVGGDLTAATGSRTINLNGGTLNVAALAGVTTRLGQGATIAPLSGTTVNFAAATSVVADGALYLGGTHVGAGALNKSGAGDFGLAGDATGYTGAINVNAGSVSIVPTIARSGATAFANPINLDTGNTGTNVNINFAQAVPLEVASTITLGQTSATYGINSFGLPNQNANITGKITGGSAGTTVTFTGFFKISSTTNDYVGTTSVNGATSIAIVTPTAFGNPTTNLFLWNNGGIEGAVGANLVGANKLTYESVITPNFAAFFNGNTDLEFGGNITSSTAGGSVGTNEVQKNGLGKLILSGTVTLGGRIGLNGGGGTIARPRILQFNGNNAGTSAAIANALLYIDQGGNQDTEYVELTGGATVTNFSLFAKGRSTNETFAGQTAADRRTSGLILSNLSGENTWTGGLAIRAGGGGFSVRSQAGTLNIGGNLYNNVAYTATDATATALGGARGWEFTGAGNGKLTGTITDAGGPAPITVNVGRTFIAVIGETDGSNTTGAGTWSIEGSTGNNFTGGLTVIDGTLNVNGATNSTSAVLTNKANAWGGTLGGVGSISQAVTIYGAGLTTSVVPVEGILVAGVQTPSIAPATVASKISKGGTLNPGNANSPIGTLNVAALSMRAGVDATAARGKLNIDLDAGSNDKLLVAGDASLAAGTLVLNRVGGVMLTQGAPRELVHVNGTITGPFATVAGVAQSPTASLAVTYTDHAVNVQLAFPGDATLDNTVNFDDLVPLAQNYNKLSGQSWVNGDFDGSGGVNFDDLVPLAQNYNHVGPPTLVAGVLGASFASDWALAQSLVPEPTALAALGGLAAMAITRRRRV